MGMSNGLSGFVVATVGGEAARVVSAARLIELDAGHLAALGRRHKTLVVAPLDPQPPSELAMKYHYTSYRLVPEVSRRIGVYSMNDYERLPKEPGLFGVAGATGVVRELCGASEWASPFGVPGDTLRVVEPWVPLSAGGLRVLGGGIRHDARDPRVVRVATPSSMAGLNPHRPWKWRAARTMPRWASRWRLDVVEVECVRIRELTTLDQQDDGVDCWTKDGALYKYGYAEPGEPGGWDWAEMPRSVHGAFERGWNARFPATPWAADPYVWKMRVSAVRINPEVG